MAWNDIIILTMSFAALAWVIWNMWTLTKGLDDDRDAFSSAPQTGDSHE